VLKVIFRNIKAEKNKEVSMCGRKNKGVYVMLDYLPYSFVLKVIFGNIKVGKISSIIKLF
jgi:uncharacterized pyridoxamine 5'-phosphate oxidase family protein